MSHPQANVPGDEVVSARRQRTQKNNRPIKKDYVVTVIQDHYVTVKARTEQDAERLGLQAINARWGGGGCNPRVVEVEELK